MRLQNGPPDSSTSLHAFPDTDANLHGVTRHFGTEAQGPWLKLVVHTCGSEMHELCHSCGIFPESQKTLGFPEAEAKSAGGILLPDSAKQEMNQAQDAVMPKFLLEGNS